MWFKTIVKKVAKEIIEKEKMDYIIKDKDFVHLAFCLETIYQYENEVLTCKNAKNYNKYYDCDIDDLIKEFGEEKKEYFDLWIISDHILEEIGNLGYVAN